MARARRQPALIAAQTFRLANGLQVVLHPDGRLPRVVVNLLYRIGARDDPPGRSGLAHLFEHLMFMGTRRVPENQFDLLMEEMGGSNNAFTSEDVTDYYDMGPSRILDTLLWVEADRMAAMASSIDRRKLDLQREVVLNERRQQYENAPYGQAALALPGLLYRGRHPYSWPVIGSAEDISAITVSDVKQIFRSHYSPGNASLVVAGRFDPVQARELVRQRFEWIPSPPRPARRRARASHLTEERRLALHDRVELPRVIMAWHSPPGYAAGDAELDMAGAILSAGKQSRLRRALMHERQLAVQVDARQESRQLGSLFTVDVMGRAGVSLEDLERATRRVIGRFLAAPPRQRELQSARNIFRTDFISRLEQLSRRAELLNLYLASLGRADFAERDLQRYAALTPERVHRWSQQVLARPAAVITVAPGEQLPGR